MKFLAQSSVPSTTQMDTDSNGNPINIIDHGGLYFGYWNGLPSNFPTNYAWQTGLTRSGDLATAQSTFP